MAEVDAVIIEFYFLVEYDCRKYWFTRAVNSCHTFTKGEKINLWGEVFEICEVIHHLEIAPYEYVLTQISASLKCEDEWSFYFLMRILKKHDSIDFEEGSFFTSEYISELRKRHDQRFEEITQA